MGCMKMGGCVFQETLDINDSSDAREQKIIKSIERYLADNGFTYTPWEKKDLSKIDVHIKAMVYSMLSNQRRWEALVPRLPQIDLLFFQYDKASIMSHSAGYFENGIRTLKCGNVSTKAQMASLHNNIRVLERIEKEYSSINAFYNSKSLLELVTALSSKESDYKFGMMGEALICEYLKNLGHDVAKPDVHLCRILGSERLAFSPHTKANPKEVYGIVDQFNRATGKARAYIDFLLWSYCAKERGEICTANPACHKCVIKQFCVKGGRK